MDGLWGLYAASENVYNRIKDAISNDLKTIPDIECAESKELGRVNRVAFGNNKFTYKRNVAN